MNKKEFKELDREQMIIAFNQLKDDYSSLFDELEQEKEKTPESVRKQFETYQDKICELEEKNKELEKYKTYYEEMEEVNKKFIAVDKIKELLENEIIDISGFRCIAVEDIKNLLEEK